MKYKYIVIADEDTLLGFRIAGVAGIAVSNRSEALSALEDAKSQDYGVIILTQEVAEMVRAEVDAMRFGATLPMVVEIPGARGPMEKRRELSDIIREAIGIKV